MFDSNYIVTKEIRFQDLSGNSTEFLIGTLIQYHRHLDGNITIWLSNSTPERSGYTGRDFDIENYIEPISEYTKPKEKPYHVQVEHCEDYSDLNRFLETIDGEDVINIIETPKHFSVVYKEKVNGKKI